MKDNSPEVMQPSLRRAETSHTDIATPSAKFSRHANTNEHAYCLFWFLLFFASITFFFTPHARAGDCFVEDAQSQSPNSVIVAVGPERFCIPKTWLNVFDIGYSGSLLYLSFILTPESEIGDPVGLNFRGTTISVSVEAIPGNVRLTNARLLDNVLKNAKRVEDDGGFAVYRGMPTDIFVDKEASAYFFECFPMAKFEQKPGFIYNRCQSAAVDAAGMLVSFVFPPIPLGRFRYLRMQGITLLQRLRVQG